MKVEIFRKREKPIQNITLIALIIALQASFSLITTFIPDLIVIPLLIILLIPLTSVIVPLYCQKNYLIVYLISSIAINLAVSSINLTNTIFYMIPSILIGFFYGLFLKLKFPTSLNIFGLSLITLVLWIISLYIIKGMYGIDMQETLLKIIGKNTTAGKNIFLLFGYFFSLAQLTLIHLFIMCQSKYLGIENKFSNEICILYPIFAAFFASFSALFGLWYLDIAYLLFGFAIYWSVYCLYQILKERNQVIILLTIVSCLLMIIPFAFAYKNFSKESALLLTNLYLIPLIIFSFLNSILSKRKG